MNIIDDFASIRSFMKGEDDFLPKAKAPEVSIIPHDPQIMLYVEELTELHQRINKTFTVNFPKATWRLLNQGKPIT